MSELRGRGGSGGFYVGGGGGGGGGPSNLHLKKELNQIRKAGARALRDPGTTSSWRSPLGSARSAAAIAAASTSAKHHYYHHHKDINGGGNGNLIDGDEGDGGTAVSRRRHSPNQLLIDYKPKNNGTARNNKKVFLYNWKTQKSESDISAATALSRRNDRRSTAEDEDSSSVPEESVDGSLSDARYNGNDSKSDTYATDRYASMILCKDTNFTPSIRRTTKKKPKKNSYNSSNSRKFRPHILPNRSSNRAMEGLNNLGLDRDDLLSLVSQSDEYNSENLRRTSTVPPLMARLKHKNWSGSSSKLMKNSKKEDDSYSYSTPALSTNSFKRYKTRNPSTIGSWDATTISLNDDEDDEIDDHLDFPGGHGCGIPCYWSRRSTPKYRGGSGSYYSPSLSDTLRRKGIKILRGSDSSKRRIASRTKQGLVPLLRKRGGSSIGTGQSDDELSTNLGELDLEALSRLDGRRWSSCCRSQEEGSRSSPENIGSLSQKYRPIFFDEIVGQNIVVQSLKNAISKGRIAPVYLFQGPRGTGKTCTARIFAAALNCLAAEQTKPCGVCRECADFIAGKSGDLLEVDGAHKEVLEGVRYLLNGLLSVGSTSMYKVFVIDECHLLSAKSWLAFLKFLEDPPPNVVFIFITTDLDSVPRTVLSRCQKYLFSKIKEGDIVITLKKIVDEENLEVELDALDLIALNADGSLRDAETMLDQLSLLGSKITTSLVNELLGVVSDEKLLELLEIAMSSDTAETVKRAREMMDSGVDPMFLMSQLATLIMDIIAGTYQIVDSKCNDSSFFGGRSLSESEMERLKQALKILSESEKRLRVSSERSTWFTATLLQLGSATSPDLTQSGSSMRLSSKTTEEEPPTSFKETTTLKQRNSTILEEPFVMKEGGVGLKSNVLDDIWVRCIERCHSKTLRQLLHSYGKLVSISEVEGVFVAFIAFGNRDIKIRAERFLSSITNSFEIVLRSNVEVRIVLLPEGDVSINGGKTTLLPASLNQNQTETNNSVAEPNDMKLEVPKQRIESIINEQRLETAWLQAMEKPTPGSMSHSKPERNQVLPQDGIYHHHNKIKLTNSIDLDSRHWEDELNHEIKALKINNDGMALQKDQIGKRGSNYPMSPSLLHDSGFTGNFGKDNMGYESGTGAAGGCSSLFCWNAAKHPKRGKVKQGTLVGSRRNRRFLWFGECVKSRRSENRHRR